MGQSEADSSRILELLEKMPPQVRERVGYIIEGAALMSGVCSQEQKAETQSA